MRDQVGIADVLVLVHAKGLDNLVERGRDVVQQLKRTLQGEREA